MIDKKLTFLAGCLTGIILKDGLQIQTIEYFVAVIVIIWGFAGSIKLIAKFGI